MIVLHAAVLEGALHLWGEGAESGTGEPPAGLALGAGAGDGNGTVAGSLPRGGRRKARPAVDAGRANGGARGAAKPHPLDAGADRLAAAIDLTPGGFFLGPERFGALDGWLPTLGGQPLPSSPVLGVGTEVAAGGTVELRPWRVTAAGLDTTETVTFLSFLPPPGTELHVLAPGVFPSPALHFWREAFAFAVDLVARHRHLPSLVRDGRRWRAVWEPVLSGTDAARASALARAMPGASRALRSTEGGGAAQRSAAPDSPAATTLRHFLGHVVDHLVRSSTWRDFEPPDAPAPATSLDGRWVQALVAGDGWMEGRPRELTDLCRRIEDWQRPVTATAGQPLRLCFRLDEPPHADPETDGLPGDALDEADEQPWTLHYLMQSTADPSLLVPAADLLGRGARDEATALRAFGPRAREFLLTGLGQAAAVSPVVGAGLRRGGNGGVALSTADAHAFLHADAPSLDQAGFGVFLPSWWVRGRPRVQTSLRARVNTAPTEAGTFSLGALLDVQWEAVLGSDTLSRDELERLAALKQPLVRLRGQWIEVDAGAVRDLLRRVRRPARVTGFEALRMALGARGASAAGVDEVEVVATGWLGDLLVRLSEPARLTELGPPAGLEGTLRPYQLRGYSWLAFLRDWGLGACLADDMGLGKTVQTLALIQRDREADPEAGPVLLVCPTSVIGNWQREAARFTPGLRVLVHHGPGRLRWDEIAPAAAEHDLVLTGYALLNRDGEELQAIQWRGVVLDEAQNIKNPDTHQARSARALPAGYRVALTGTPVENHVGDLWSLMEFLNPGLLGSKAAFRREIQLPIQLRRDERASQHLRRLTGPFVLRRLKTDPTIITDLPEKVEVRQYCTLTPEQASLYRAVLREAEASLEDADEGIGRKGIILATLTRLKQVCNHPAHFLGDGSAPAGRSGKLQRMTSLVEEILGEGERALIFTQFTEMGSILKRHLQDTFGREVLFLHGGVDRTLREAMVQRFQDPSAGAPPLFLLSLRAGGTGLNLTAASHVFHYDRWWNPAVEDQATDRAFRIGQRRNVQVHKLVCTGTLEERIDEMIQSKKALAEMVVSTGEGWLTEMDNDALREILALSDAAVSNEEA